MDLNLSYLLLILEVKLDWTIHNSKITCSIGYKVTMSLAFTEFISSNFYTKEMKVHTEVPCSKNSNKEKTWIRF